MENSNVYQVIDVYSTKYPLGWLARSPPIAVLVLILCGIIILPALIFIMMTSVALFLTYVGILEISGDVTLFKLMFFGFLISVGIIFLLTSGIIFAWYYGLRRMYQKHFNLKMKVPVVKEQ